jgi:MFS family permease
MTAATGGLSSILPVYLSEISSASSRGRTAALLPITLNCSLLFAALVAQCVASDTVHGWQWAYLWGLLPSAAISIGVWCAPESPRWLLVNKGRGSASRALQVGEIDVPTELHRYHICIYEIYVPT